MSEQNYTIVRELSDGGKIIDAWFPTAEACEKFDLPSFEGYLFLHVALERNPEAAMEPIASNWELLRLSDVEEDCTIYVCT